MKARSSSVRRQALGWVDSAQARSASTCSRTSEMPWESAFGRRIAGLASPCQVLPGALMLTKRDKPPDERCAGGARGSWVRRDSTRPAAAAPEWAGRALRGGPGAEGGIRPRATENASHSSAVPQGSQVPWRGSASEPFDGLRRFAITW